MQEDGIRDLHASKIIKYCVGLSGTLNTGVGGYWVCVDTHTREFDLDGEGYGYGYNSM